MSEGSHGPRFADIDDALLAAEGAGSLEAAFELFDRHGGAVYALASLLTPDEEAASTVVEDVFVSLWRREGRLEDPPAGVRLGLLAMAARRCLGGVELAEPANRGGR